MRQFISEVFDAPNVLTIPVDTKVVDEFAPLVHAPLDRSRFVCVRPPWNSDVRWISACHEESFELFQSAFDRLGIAEAVAASAAMGR